MGRIDVGTDSHNNMGQVHSPAEAGPQVLGVDHRSEPAVGSAEFAASYSEVIQN